MRILAIAAHPDDENYASGWLIKNAIEGHEVYILFTTRGEGGSPGVPPLCAQHELGKLREKEARAAGVVLGVQETLFLAYVDPLMQSDKLYPISASLQEFSWAIRDIIERLHPDVILTHGSNGEYGHPQHIFTHQAVLYALREIPFWRSKEVLTWNAVFPDPEFPEEINQDDPADFTLDVQPWLERKVAAFMEHHSQHGALQKLYPGKPLALLAARIESYRRWNNLL